MPRGNPNWTKGTSGNPAGRRKGQPAIVLAPILRRVLMEIQAVPDGEGGTLTKTNRELIVEKLIDLARGGDLDAIKIVLERVDGRVPVPKDDDGAADRELTVDEMLRAFRRERERQRTQEQRRADADRYR